MPNGIEAMKDTTDELTLKSELGYDNQVPISIGDAGMGLAAKDANKIFNAFFTTKPEGTGMGLAISRSIAASHRAISGPRTMRDQAQLFVSRCIPHPPWTHELH